MNKKISTFIIVLGSAVGTYNASLYGFFAFLIAPFYFPFNNSLASYSAALSVFAIGFIMRPLGGIIFGRIEGTYGRKRAFILAILLTTLSTCCIGILPTYNKLSIVAPLILFCCVVLQGLCVAGTYTGASLLAIELSKERNRGLACSLLPTAGTIGMGVAAILGAVFTWDSLPTWAWRIPFLFSLILGGLVFFLRHYFIETPLIQTEGPQSKKRYPLTKVFKHQKGNFFCGIGLSATATAVLYVFMIYVMSLSIGNNKSLTLHQSMLINAAMIVLQIIFLPLMGALSDKIGTKRLMQYGFIGAILITIPFFWFIHQHISVLRVAFVISVFTLLHAGFVGPVGGLFVSLFPPSDKSAGISFSMALGSAMAGAVTPIIVFLFMQLTNHNIGVASYLMFFYFIGWLCTFKAQLIPEFTEKDEFVSDTYVVSAK